MFKINCIAPVIAVPIPNAIGPIIINDRNPVINNATGPTTSILIESCTTLLSAFQLKKVHKPQ